jgi:hypothetical protein
VNHFAQWGISWSFGEKFKDREACRPNKCNQFKEAVTLTSWLVGWVPESEGAAGDVNGVLLWPWLHRACSFSTQKG